jgi:hypothetical protein
MYQQFNHPTRTDLLELQGDFERSLNDLYERDEDAGDIECFYDHYDENGNLIEDFETNPLYDL